MNEGAGERNGNELGMSNGLELGLLLTIITSKHEVSAHTSFLWRRAGRTCRS